MGRTLQIVLVVWLCSASGLAVAEAGRQAGAKGRQRTDAAPPARDADREVLKRWQQLKLKERELLRNKLALWKKLPPARRRQIQENFNRFLELSPGKRRQLRRRAERFHQLPIESRRALVNRHRQWMSLPEETRRLARRALALLEDLLAEDYKRLKEAPRDQRQELIRPVKQKLQALLKLPPDRVKELKGLAPEERKKRIGKLLQQTKMSEDKAERPPKDEAQAPEAQPD